MRPRHGSISAWWRCAIAGTAAALYAPTAAASPDYPDELQAALGLACPPRCTLCHQDRQGGLGTIKAASFGETVMNINEVGADDAAGLRCALELLAPECDDDAPPACAATEQRCFAADTDGDGMRDVDELRAQRDPNQDGEGFLCGATYGCGAELSPPAAPSGWPLVAVSGAVLVGIVASRRRQRR